MEIILFIIFIIALWIFSIFLLSYWKYIYWFAFLNLTLIIFYFAFIIYGSDYLWGHDEYGLGTLVRLIFGVTCQTIIGFIFAIYKSYKLKKDEKST
jgi:hypothetical protein